MTTRAQYAELKSDPVRYAEYKRRTRERRRQWYLLNKEKVQSQYRSWREANREKVSARGAAYREANREKVSARGAAYREANRERMREYRREYRLANRDRIREYNHKWRLANPDRVRTRHRRDKLLRKEAPGFHTEAEWQALCSYYMDQCLCCGNVPDKLTRDHVVPLSMGGSDDISNIQPLCSRCNDSEGTNTMDYR